MPADIVETTAAATRDERIWSSVTPQLAADLPRRLANIYSLDDLEPRARKHLPRRIFGFVEGGVETNAARDANRAAFAAWSFRPRVLVNTVGRSLATSLFGTTYAAPFGIAPMGATSLMAFECERVLAEAAGEANIPFILSGSSLMPLETILRANPAAWFQAYIPGDRARIGPLVDRVARAGYRTLVITVDVAVAGNRENNARNGFMLPLRPGVSLAWDGITHPRWLVGNLCRTLLTRGMPHLRTWTRYRGAGDLGPGGAELWPAGRAVLGRYRLDPRSLAGNAAAERHPGARGRASGRGDRGSTASSCRITADDSSMERCRRCTRCRMCGRSAAG